MLKGKLTRYVSVIILISLTSCATCTGTFCDIYERTYEKTANEAVYEGMCCTWYERLVDKCN